MMQRILSKGETQIGFNIFYPLENEEYDDEYECKFETFGLRDNISGSAIGIDAIDALTNAMMRLDIFLKSTQEFREEKIRWIGGITPDDFGLPWNDPTQCSSDF